MGGYGFKVVSVLVIGDSAVALLSHSSTIISTTDAGWFAIAPGRSGDDADPSVQFGGDSLSGNKWEIGVDLLGWRHRSSFFLRVT